MGIDTLTDVQAKYWRLRRSPLLDCLSDGDVKQLGAMCQVRVVERGVVLYDAGDPGRLVFIVETGAVKLSRVSDDGREVTVGVLGPMEMFGERAIAGETTRSDRAAVLDDAVVCAFEREQFERFLFAHPELALRVTKLIGERLHRVESRIQDILFKDVRTRLAHTLARLADKFGEDVPEGRRIALRLTQTDLAQLIGSTRETTSTIFNEFRRQELVDTDDHHVIVPDMHSLAMY
jgi:CRP/FNR family transcriptional regulator